VNLPICGVHFDARGRVFVSTPRLVSAKSPATLNILDIRATTGPALLSAFTSAEANAVGSAPDQNLRSVLGFHVDRNNGWLWALDQGFVAGESEALAGAQKILQTVRKLPEFGVKQREEQAVRESERLGLIGRLTRPKRRQDPSARR
jgi:hypothetical protein